MSRSKKKTNIIKDKKNSTYHRRVRRHVSNKLRTHLVGVETYEDSFDVGEPPLPSPKSVVNDYDYRDHRWFIDEDDDTYIRKALRK